MYGRAVVFLILIAIAIGYASMMQKIHKLNQQLEDHRAESTFYVTTDSLDDIQTSLTELEGDLDTLKRKKKKKKKNHKKDEHETREKRHKSKKKKKKREEESKEPSSIPPPGDGGGGGSREPIPPVETFVSETEGERERRYVYPPQHMYENGPMGYPMDSGMAHTTIDYPHHAPFDYGAPYHRHYPPPPSSSLTSPPDLPPDVQVFKR